MTARARSSFGEFVGAVEAALCGFVPSSGAWSEPPSPQDAAKVRTLLSLLRSRYGARPDALRQASKLSCGDAAGDGS